MESARSRGLRWERTVSLSLPPAALMASAPSLSFLYFLLLHCPRNTLPSPSPRGVLRDTERD